MKPLHSLSLVCLAGTATLTLAAAPAFAATDLTTSLKSSSPFSSWTTGDRRCNQALGTTTAGILYNGSAAYESCIGSFDIKSTGNDVLGNGNGPLLTALNSGIFGGITKWSFGGKTGETTGDLDFQVAGVGNQATGGWTFQNLPTGFNADLVISLKTATDWSAYYIKKGTISDFSTATLNWNTIGVDLNGKGNAGKDLSHAAVFYANPSTPNKKVPEPTTGLAMGLLGLGFWRRFRQR